MLTLTISQTAVKGFISTDPMRPAMCGVHFNAKKQRIEMTDSHKLAFVPCESDEESVVLPVEAFPKTSGNVTDLEQIDGLRWSVIERHPKKGVVSERIITAIDERFPNMQAVLDHMPKPEPIKQITVDASFFEPFYVLDKQTGGSGDVKITFHGQTAAMLIQSNDKKNRFTGLLMPVAMR